MTLSLQDEIAKILEVAFAEDIGTGDVTSLNIISKNAVGKFAFNSREKIVFCGEEIIRMVFPEAKLFTKDGQTLSAGTVIAEVSGNVIEILSKERVVLNLLQHLSGIATETAKYVAEVADTRAKILDTRKTIPGLRKLAKYAVKCGGGQNHRMGLYDMVMIKDNHIKAAGGISEAVKKARLAKLKVEVECDNLNQVEEAKKAGADIILADNMTNEDLIEAVKIAGNIPVEASGNVTIETIKSIAKTGVYFISTSKITMAAKSVDIGLDEI